MMDSAENKGLRSELLTILCVLSFIGSGIGILSGINNYREADLTSALMKDQLQRSKTEVKQKSGSDEGAALAEKIINNAMNVTDPESVKKHSVLSAICNLITLIGAFMMFRLKRLGFWIYLAGTIALVAVPVAVYGAGNFLSIGMSGIYGLIGLVFVVLYSRTLKYMN